MASSKSDLLRPARLAGARGARGSLANLTRDVKELGRRHDILVAAARAVEHNLGASRETRAELPQVRERVGSFKSRDDAFQARSGDESVEGFLVGDGVVLGAAKVLEEGVFRTDTRVIETSGNRVRFDDLTFTVLDKVREGAVEHTRGTQGERRGVLLTRTDTLPSGFDADDFSRIPR